jgi:hypothetical protein
MTSPNGRCAICQHPERVRIELLSVGGASARAVAKQFRASSHSIYRHMLNHVSAGRRAQLIAGSSLKPRELAEKAAAEGMALIDYLSLMRSVLLQQFLAATEASDRNGAATVAGRLLECLRMQATLTGEISRAGAVVNNNMLILQSPVMADLQQMLIARLRPYPEAAKAVIEGLQELSARALEGTRSQQLAAPPLKVSHDRG